MVSVDLDAATGTRIHEYHKRATMVAMKQYMSRSGRESRRKPGEPFVRFNAYNLTISAGVVLEAHVTDAGYARLYGDRDTGVVEIEFADERVQGEMKVNHRKGRNISVSILGLMHWMGLDVANYPDRLPVEIVGERWIRFDLSKPSALDA